WCARPRTPRQPEFPSPRSGRTRNYSSLSSAGTAPARHLVDAAILERKRSEAAAPHAATIEGGELRCQLQPKRRPMAAKDGRLTRRSQFKPGPIATRRLGAFRAKVHPAFARAETHARHRVDDGAQPV